MEKLREILETKVKILSEKKNKYDSMTILAPWIVTGRKNQNGRLYGHDLIQREVARLQPSIKAGSAIGNADHPAGALSTLADASHIITKLELDKDGKGWMTAKILNTTKGKNVVEIIKAGGQLGISARGAGNVSSSGTVESDYKLLGIDFCTSPSEPEAVFDKSNICESLEFSEDEDAQKQKDLEEAVNNLEKESYLNALDSGFIGSQEDWEELSGGNLRTMMGLKEDDGKTTVQKLTEETVKKRTFFFYEEAVRGGYRKSFDEWKEEYPKLVEQASKGIKIEEKKEPEPKETFKAKISWSEAVKSGFTGTIAEFKKQYPDVVLEVPKIPEKPITENLEQEAQRIFAGLKRDNPNSSVTFESVKKYLEKEEEAQTDKRLRERAIAIVSRDLAGNVSQEVIERMVESEFQALKTEREERKKKNWEAYRRLLDE